MPNLSDQDILAFVKEQERVSIGFRTYDGVTEQENEALRRYLGWPYGDEEDGRSQVISMDASQVVDWAIPDLLEPFVSGPRAVEFEPTKESEEEAAEQATLYINHLFSVDNPGFEVLHSAAKDGLIQKIGITKLLWNENKRVTEQTYTGQSIINLQTFRADADAEVPEVTSEDIALSPLPEVALAQAQAFPDGKVYTIQVEHTNPNGRIEVISVPPEEFRIATRSSSVDSALYTAHTTRKTKGELLEMGFDKKKVEEANDIEYPQQAGRNVRFYEEPNIDRATPAVGESIDWRLAKRWLHEEYVLIDYNQDDDMEIMQVFRVGNTIFSVEEVACDPFATFSPFPMPHRAIGQGMVDKVRQTQRAKTVLTRQMLDNVYLANNPQREVPEDAVTDDGATYDDLLNFRVGGLVRTKKPGMLREIAVLDRSDVALKALAYMDTVREADSGVVRAPIGLSAEAVDKELSATEAAQIERGSMKRDRLMARVFAEMYLALLFRKMLKFVVQYQDKPREIKLSGSWTMIDPRTWNTEMHVIPNVGLGHENRDSQAAAAQVLANFQEKAAQIGMAGPQEFWQTAKDLTQALGKRFPEQYFVDPNSDEGKARLKRFEEQKANQPDPIMAQIQARSQIEAAKVQQDGQFKQLKLQQDGQVAQLKMQQDAQISMAKAQLQAQTDVQKARMSAQGDSEQAAQDFEVNVMKAQQAFEANVLKIQEQTALAEEKMNREFALAIEEQNREFFLALRGQDLQAEAAEEGEGAPRISGGNGISSEANFGGPVG